MSHSVVFNVRCRKHDGMACSIIGSRLDYCNSLFAGISEHSMDSIQRVQSKAARIVWNAGRHSLSSDLLHSLHWLDPGSRCGWTCNQLTSKVDGGITGSRSGCQLPPSL